MVQTRSNVSTDALNLDTGVEVSSRRRSARLQATPRASRRTPAAKTRRERGELAVELRARSDPTTEEAAGGTVPLPLPSLAEDEPASTYKEESGSSEQEQEAPATVVVAEPLPDAESEGKADALGKRRREEQPEEQEAGSDSGGEDSDSDSGEDGEEEAEGGVGEGEAGAEFSCSESETDNPLGSLAQSMWQALSGMSQPSPTSDNHWKRRRLAAEGGTESSKHRQRNPDLEAAKWRPRTQLPPPVHTQDTSCLLTAAVAPKMARRLASAPEDKRRVKDVAGKVQDPNRTKPRSWHELPVTPITEEVKRDLRLLRLRGALDPKRFYKTADKKKFPTRFQMGTVNEGPTDFYAGRLTQRERKATLTEELLADPVLTASRTKRFGALQAERTRKGVKPRKTDKERVKSRPNKKPRH